MLLHSSWLRLFLLFDFMLMGSISPPPHVPQLLFPQSMVPMQMQSIQPDVASFADAALKRLASLLASYGLGLPELSPQQLSSLSTLLQLLQSSSE